jgi:hypothetical protein
VGDIHESRFFMNDAVAITISRAAALILIAALTLWPLARTGHIGPASLFIVALLVVAALEPRRFGPRIGKGLMIFATMAAFYDPPSGFTFSLDRFLPALPFLVAGVLLNLPEIL